MKGLIDFSTITACGECCTGCKKKESGLCKGCIESDGHCEEWAQSKGCPIHKCARKHEVQFCGLCPEFPCTWLKEKIVWNPNAISHLEELADLHWFQRMVEALNLGTLSVKTEQVSGGYMHKMYRLETTQGRYAVKVLNSMVMKRPDALDNYERAECLEKILQENKLPVVPALEIDKRKMQCVDGKYFYVFEWSDGKAIPWREITGEHCKIIGGLLAKIHKLEQPEHPGNCKQGEETCEPENFSVDWEGYAELAKVKCPEIAEILWKNVALLKEAQESYNEALKSAPKLSCICNGDMDSKNVLWLDGKPQIIDLECLDYGNPFVEMFQLALSWSGGVVNNLDYECLREFISSYKKEYGEIKVDLKALYGIGFSWLDWLDYNVRRALGIECADASERQLGITQVSETLERIVYYTSIKEEVLSYLEEI